MSAPELFSAAQSSGLCPGARTTFARSLDLDSCVGGFVVEGGGIREEEEENGAGGPGIRRAGIGGGGIRVDGARETRWALSMAGNAGGESSSSGCWTEKVGFVGVVGDSSSSSAGRLLLGLRESVGSHERR